MSDFSTTSHPVAAKEHSCHECQRVIAKGEQYARTFGVWEGNACTVVVCAHCEVLREAVGKVDGGYYEEAFYGGLGEWVGQRLWREFDVDVPLLRMIASFRMSWRFSNCGDLMPIPEVTS